MKVVKIQELLRLKMHVHNGGVVAQNRALDGLYTTGRRFASL
jgi:hypothetical protein